MTTTGADDEPLAYGVVLETGRGSLPFELIHGEPLVAAASWALEAAGVRAVELTTEWTQVQAREAPLVLHDVLCPMTPPEFLAGCVTHAQRTDTVVVGVRPVTDTVKVVRGEFVGQTLDRDGLVSVCSPVVLPPGVVAGLERWPGDDLAGVAAALAENHPIEQLEAPPEARRIRTSDDVELLAALTEPRG